MLRYRLSIVQAQTTSKLYILTGYKHSSLHYIAPSLCDAPFTIGNGLQAYLEVVRRGEVALLLELVGLLLERGVRLDAEEVLVPRVVAHGEVAAGGLGQRADGADQGSAARHGQDGCQQEVAGGAETDLLPVKKSSSTLVRKPIIARRPTLTYSQRRVHQQMRPQQMRPVMYFNLA